MVLEEPKVVLDTNVASYIYTRNSRARFYESATEGMRPVISFQTLEEIMITPITRMVGATDGSRNWQTTLNATK